MAGNGKAPRRLTEGLQRNVNYERTNSMNRITKLPIPCTTFHNAVAHLVLEYFQDDSGPISLVSKEEWPDVNVYFLHKGITEAVLRRVFDNWPGPEWIEFVPSSNGSNAVWKAPHEPDAFGITRNEA